MLKSCWSRFVFFALLATVADAVRAPLTFAHVNPLQISRFRRASANALPLTGIPATAYLLAMQIGTPPQNFSFLCDTGSSNLAVAGSPSAGANPFYTQSDSSTAQSTGGTITTNYLQGSWSANRVKDVVEVTGSTIPPTTAEFASIYSSSQFFTSESSISFQGIFGLAFIALASPSDNPVVPLFDDWVNNGLYNGFGMQLCDPHTETSVTGEVTLVPSPSIIDLGATEADVQDLASGSFAYTPLVQQLYYMVTVVDMAIGGQSLGVDCSLYNSPTAIVDSGTTELLVPQAAYNVLVGYLSNAMGIPQGQQQDFFAGNECFVFSRSSLEQMPSITVSITTGSGAEAFDLVVPPWHYTRVIEVSSILPPDSECRVFSVAPTCGTVMGVAVMSGYTVLFDRANNRVGFAVSTCSTSSGFPAIPPIAFHAANISCPAVSTDVCSSCSSLFSEWAATLAALFLVLVSLAM